MFSECGKMSKALCIERLLEGEPVGFLLSSVRLPAVYQESSKKSLLYVPKSLFHVL